MLQHDNVGTDRSSSLTGSKVFLRNSSQNTILPSDNRRYKSTSIASAIENYTFRPQVNNISKKIAQEHYRQIRSIASKLSQGRSPDPKNQASNEIISISIQTGHEQQVEESKVQSDSPGKDRSAKKGYEHKIHLI